MTRERRRRPPWRATVIAAGLATVLLSACATVPHGGPVQAGQAAAGVFAGQGRGYAELVAVPPQPGWNPTEIVEGFLAATASFTGDHAVARKYLAPADRLLHPWRPGWAVTVVTSLQASQVGYSATQTVPQVTASVRVTGKQQLATLNQAGQYVGTQQQPGTAINFSLIKVNGAWRITNPPNQLLLTEADFQGVYAQRNLYYLTPDDRALVPDPVYVPQQATPVTLASQLVTALLTDPQGWLEGGAQTAFPKARLRGVSISAGTVTANLDAPAGIISEGAQLSQMTSQLIWTLASGLPSVQAVRLEIDGKPAGSATWSGGQPAGLPVTVPEQAATTSLYSIAPGGAVQQLKSTTLLLTGLVPGEAGTGRIRLTTVAVSPDALPSDRWLAGLTASGRLYYGELRPKASLATGPANIRFTSVSWDDNDELWAAGPQGLWEISAGASPVQVQLGPSLRGEQIRQFRVAPDGVRAAMILTRPNGTQPQLEITAIVSPRAGVYSVGRNGTPEPIGADVVKVASPVQLTWYDAENLIVLAHSALLGPELFEVPVDGGSSTTLTTDLDTVSVSADGPASPIVVGLANGQIASTRVLNGEWTPALGSETAPTYPG